MLQVTGFAMCSWTNDAYRAWVAQNAGTIGAGVLGLAGKWANAFAPWLMGADGMNTPTLSGFNVGRGVFESTALAIGQKIDHERTPPQAHGNANVSLTYQAGLLTFFFYRKHIKEEYAEIIDDYFDMYGYKINAVKVPNRAARPCYTYVKTIGCAVDGQLPADDAKKIQSIFDAGIRFWKATAEFGNYNPYVNPNEVTVGE